MKIPIFLFHGFLEAGKTAFIRYMLNKPVFADGQNTLVVMCEEGIEAYDKAFFEKNHISLVSLDEETHLSDELLQSLSKKYNPQRVIIEYNGMWHTSKILELSYPKEWFLYEIMTIVNGETLELYINNMRGMMMEQFKCSDLVILNRVSEEMNLTQLKGAVKAVNTGAKLFLCTEDFQLEPVKEELPYEIQANPIEISEENYGIWYMDIWEHPERYQNKKVKVSGLFFQAPSDPKDRFNFGRFAMPCCEDDISMMGVYCHNIGKPRFRNGQSITLEAVIQYEKAEVYHGDRGPVFYVKCIQAAETNQEKFVVFN